MYQRLFASVPQRGQTAVTSKIVIDGAALWGEIATVPATTGNWVSPGSTVRCVGGWRNGRRICPFHIKPGWPVPVGAVSRWAPKQIPGPDPSAVIYGNAVGPAGGRVRAVVQRW